MKLEPEIPMTQLTRACQQQWQFYYLVLLSTYYLASVKVS